MTEQIKYIKKGDKYIGRLTNYPCCCQADSLDNLRKRLGIMLSLWVVEAQKVVANDDFELKEIQEYDFLTPKH